MSFATTSANQWIWIAGEVLYAVHAEQLAEHGGFEGVRDPNAFESALSRPEQLAHYGTPDAADLAAAYGFGIARNHPFADGNKRTAFVAVELFLALNGRELGATDSECVITILHLAAGELTENEFAQWLRQHIEPR